MKNTKSTDFMSDMKWINGGRERVEINLYKGNSYLALYCIISVFFALLFGIMAISPEAMAGSLWSEENEADGFLFADQKARGVGDIVTILIYEYSEVSNDSQKITDKEYEAGINIDLDTKNLGKIPITNAGVESGSSSSERMSTRGRITAEVTARIVEILPNGNFRIEGSRAIVVNGEKQEIIVSGIIRPKDISAENTVLSTHVADAEIRVTGNPELKKSGSFLSDLWNSVTHFFKKLF